jgi:hypothetical protein
MLIICVTQCSDAAGDAPGRALAGPDRLDSGLGLGYEILQRQQTRGRGNVAIDLSGGNPAMDYAAHERTYKQFLLFTKVSIVFLVLLMAGMAYFLV